MALCKFSPLGQIPGVLHIPIFIKLCLSISPTQSIRQFVSGPITLDLVSIKRIFFSGLISLGLDVVIVFFFSFKEEKEI